MLDGHIDTAWESKTSASAPQAVDLVFCGETTFSRILLTSKNASTDAVTVANIEVCNADGAWIKVLENVSLSPRYSFSDGEAGCMYLEIPPTAGTALRLTVLETNGEDGTFNIAEIQVQGSSFVCFKDHEIVINAKHGEVVVLPDTIDIDGKQMPVCWTKGVVFCENSGKTYIDGRIGTKKSVTAVIDVSEEEYIPLLDGHWAKDEIYALSVRGVLGEDATQLNPDLSLSYGQLADWLYTTLNLDKDYVPERVSLIEDADYDSKEESKLTELALLNIFPQDAKLRATDEVTRSALAQMIYSAFRYEKDTENLPVVELQYVDKAECAVYQTELETLCAAEILSNNGSFSGGDTATNAEALVMLERLMNAITQVITYPVPNSSQVSVMPDYTVKVNGREVGTYLTYAFPGVDVKETSINGRPAAAVGISYFDFAGEADVEIILNNPDLGDAAALEIRPLSENIKPDVEGNVIRFKLYSPCNISIEPWGTARPLHLFANPIDKRLPDFTAPNVRYYGAGVHYINPTDLTDGDVVYIDGGAVVYTKPQTETSDGGTYYGYSYGSIEPTFAAAGKNITVRGRGIVSGRNTMKHMQRHQLLRIHGCENFSGDGIIMLESSGWNVFVAAQSSHVYLNNLKMVGYFANNDGIDYCDSKNGVVENCFANNADDSFIVKAWGDVENVHFKNCTAWNSVSTSFGAVAELHQTVSNVSFYDCAVIHSTNPMWQEGSGGVIGIWNAFAGDVYAMTFENIVIEDAVAGKEPIKINVDKDTENLSKEAMIQNISFKNIDMLDTRDERIALTTPFANGIRDVVFENISMNHAKILETDNRFVLQNTNNITVKP